MTKSTTTKQFEEVLESPAFWDIMGEYECHPDELTEDEDIAESLELNVPALDITDDEPLDEKKRKFGGENIANSQKHGKKSKTELKTGLKPRRGLDSKEFCMHTKKIFCNIYRRGESIYRISAAQRSQSSTRRDLSAAISIKCVKQQILRNKKIHSFS